MWRHSYIFGGGGGCMVVSLGVLFFSSDPSRGFCLIVWRKKEGGWIVFGS